MAEKTLPYVPAYGQLKKALEKIKKAETPPRFTPDYLATTLQMGGSTARPVVPFLKRAGFLGSDGTPTDLYRQFRSASSGAAAAQALRNAYGRMYAINEYIHDETSDEKLRGVIVQITGAAEDAGSVRAILGSFKVLRDFADFSASGAAAAQDEPDSQTVDDRGLGDSRDHSGGSPDRLNLSYNINLHLPATSDVAVFNAIFKSLREHLL